MRQILAAMAVFAVGMLLWAQAAPPVAALGIISIGAPGAAEAPRAARRLSPYVFDHTTLPAGDGVAPPVEEARRIAGRVRAWQEMGVHFEGQWTPQELEPVVEVLDTFDDVWDAPRFAGLIRNAAETATDGAERHITFVRVHEHPREVVGWIYPMADVVVLDGLFDDAHLRQRYNWKVLRADHNYDVEMIRRTLIAHELGHVVADGLDAESKVAGYETRGLEARYIDTVAPAHWPHAQLHVNENLATEVALWALEIDRPADVLAFRANHLAPALERPIWARQMGSRAAP